MRTILVIIAVVLFAVAGLSAAGWAAEEVHPLAAVAFGLAFWAGSILTPERLG